MSRRPKAVVSWSGGIISCVAASIARQTRDLALTGSRIAAPQGRTWAPIRGNGISSSHVPFRDAHLLAIAVSWVEAIGTPAIFIGAVAEDSSGYPDYRPENYHAFQKFAHEGTRPKTHIESYRNCYAGRRYEKIVDRKARYGIRRAAGSSLAPPPVG